MAPAVNNENKYDSENPEHKCLCADCGLWIASFETRACPDCGSARIVMSQFIVPHAEAAHGPDWRIKSFPRRAFRIEQHRSPGEVWEPIDDAHNAFREQDMAEICIAEMKRSPEWQGAEYRVARYDFRARAWVACGVPGA